MQPYQQASEEIQRQGEMPIKALGTAASLATSAFGGGLALKKVLPFLSEYIPQDLAIKGLSKLNPAFGKFISKALSEGKPFEEIKDFIKEKASSAEEKKAPDQRSIIEQYSPELSQFMKDQIQKGRSPLEAGALAEMDGKYKKDISKIIKDHKTPWSSIVESVFGGTQQPESKAALQGQQQSQQRGLDPALLNLMNSIKGSISKLQPRQ